MKDALGKDINQGDIIIYVNSGTGTYAGELYFKFGIVKRLTNKRVSVARDNQLECSVPATLVKPNQIIVLDECTRDFVIEHLQELGWKQENSVWSCHKKKELFDAINIPLADN